MPRTTILAVGVLGTDLRTLRQVFDQPDWKLIEASDCEEALLLLRAYAVPVVISAQALPDGDWRVLLDRMADLPNPARLVVCLRLPNERLWAEVLNLGGYDVLLTPLRPGEVKDLTDRACPSPPYRSEVN